MIKGFRFTNQLSNAEVDSRIHQEFLNKNDGIFYGMELSNTNNSITIGEGLCEVAGRPIAVIDSEAVNISTNSLYCVLVLEIDLSKESTKDIFEQACFKILESSSNFTSVTQQDINIYNGTNKIYQFEFARFKTNGNGITDFQDTRSFLNFEGIYNQVNDKCESIINKIKEELIAVEDGSAYILKNNIAVVSANMTLVSGYASAELSYPTGFNKNNCIVISVMTNNILYTDTKFAYGFFPTALGYTNGAISKIAILRNEDIAVRIGNPAEGSHSDGSSTYEVKVYLMKIN